MNARLAQMTVVQMLLVPTLQGHSRVAVIRAMLGMEIFAQVRC